MVIVFHFLYGLSESLLGPRVSHMMYEPAGGADIPEQRSRALDMSR